MLFHRVTTRWTRLCWFSSFKENIGYNRRKKQLTLFLLVPEPWCCRRCALLTWVEGWCNSECCRHLVSLTQYLTVAFDFLILEYFGNSKPKCRKAMADGSNLAPDLRSGVLLCVLSLLKPDLWGRSTRNAIWRKFEDSCVLNVLKWCANRGNALKSWRTTSRGRACERAICLAKCKKNYSCQEWQWFRSYRQAKKCQ